MIRGCSILFTLVVIGSGGCAPNGVGDPCTIEEPEGGFNDSDSVVEADSVQCRTGTCMVFNTETFCTTRCTIDSECNAEWYEEGPGQDDVEAASCEARVEVGAIAGQYCVPSYASKR